MRFILLFITIFITFTLHGATYPSIDEKAGNNFRDHMMSTEGSYSTNFSLRVSASNDANCYGDECDGRIINKIDWCSDHWYRFKAYLPKGATSMYLGVVTFPNTPFIVMASFDPTQIGPIDYSTSTVIGHTTAVLTGSSTGTLSLNTSDLQSIGLNHIEEGGWVYFALTRADDVLIGGNSHTTSFDITYQFFLDSQILNPNNMEAYLSTIIPYGYNEPFEPQISEQMPTCNNRSRLLDGLDPIITPLVTEPGTLMPLDEECAQRTPPHQWYDDLNACYEIDGTAYNCLESSDDAIGGTWNSSNGICTTREESSCIDDSLTQWYSAEKTCLPKMTQGNFSLNNTTLSFSPFYVNDGRWETHIEIRNISTETLVSSLRVDDANSDDTFEHTYTIASNSAEHLKIYEHGGNIYLGTGIINNPGDTEKMLSSTLRSGALHVSTSANNNISDFEANATAYYIENYTPTCAEDYEWNGSECESTYVAPVSSSSQSTYSSSSSGTTTPSCQEGYEWNGSECESIYSTPSSSSSQSSYSSSLSSESYSSSSEDYEWSSSECGTADDFPTDDFPTDDVPPCLSSQSTYGNSSSSTTTPSCQEGYEWNGSECESIYVASSSSSSQSSYSSSLSSESYSSSSEDIDNTSTCAGDETYSTYYEQCLPNNFFLLLVAAECEGSRNTWLAEDDLCIRESDACQLDENQSWYYDSCYTKEEYHQKIAQDISDQNHTIRGYFIYDVDLVPAETAWIFISANGSYAGKWNDVSDEGYMTYNIVHNENNASLDRYDIQIGTNTIIFTPKDVNNTSPYILKTEYDIKGSWVYYQPEGYQYHDAFNWIFYGKGSNVITKLEPASVNNGTNTLNWTILQSPGENLFDVNTTNSTLIIRQHQTE